jgi:hypothetical protein
MAESDRVTCPLCTGTLGQPVTSGGEGLWLRIDCRNCGDHRFSNVLVNVLDRPESYDQDTRARIAFGVKRVRSETLIDSNLLNEIEKVTVLPPAMERLSNLLIYAAEAGEPGKVLSLNPKNLRAVLGCATSESAKWVIDQAKHRKYFVDDTNPGLVTLSARGWECYDELDRSGKDSRHAFMAMSFNEPDIAAFYRDHLKRAVSETGFELRKTNDPHASAGAIDVRMKVEIRTSKFLLCDLSHGNRGAYWEAGFAEGIGRPVIYLCRVEVLVNKTHAHHPHFDTANQLIIAWDPNNPNKALNELKAVIRATLPTEAKMED